MEEWIARSSASPNPDGVEVAIGVGGSRSTPSSGDCDQQGAANICAAATSDNSRRKRCLAKHRWGLACCGIGIVLGGQWSIESGAIRRRLDLANRQNRYGTIPCHDRHRLPFRYRRSL